MISIARYDRCVIKETLTGQVVLKKLKMVSVWHICPPSQTGSAVCLMASD